jgi:lipoate synthase
VKEAMADLRAIGVDILTFGQYLQVKWYTNTLWCHLVRVLYM